YFTDLYKDTGTTATAVGANVLRIRSTATPPNVPPTVSISSPANNATFTAPATIPITARETDVDGTDTKVEFFQGTSKIGEDTTRDATNHYTFTWTNVASGSYPLTAKATDDKGASSTSSVVNVIVNPPNVPPSVSINSPTNNATFTAPATIPI